MTDYAAEDRDLVSMPAFRTVLVEWKAMLDRAVGSVDSVKPDDLKALRSEAAVMRMLLGAMDSVPDMNPAPPPPAGKGPDVLPVGKKKPVTIGVLMQEAARAGHPARWNQDTALAAVRMGEAIKRLTEHPAWARRMEFLSVLGWVLREALKVGGLIDDAAAQAALRALPAPRMMADRLVRMGVDARAFLDGQAKASVKEQEHAG